MHTHSHSPYRRGADDGFIFGIYLSVMFLASVFAMRFALLSLLVVVMFLGVPFVTYHFLRRTYVADNGLTLLSSLWMQGIMMFLCGSLICGVVSVIYLKWVNPDFIINQIHAAIELYSDSGWQSGEEAAQILQRMIDYHMVPSAISIVIEMIWLSVFSGSLLSVLMAILARARAVPNK